MMRCNTWCDTTRHDVITKMYVCWSQIWHRNVIIQLLSIGMETVLIMWSTLKLKRYWRGHVTFEEDLTRPDPTRPDPIRHYLSLHDGSSRIAWRMITTSDVVPRYSYHSMTKRLFSPLRQMKDKASFSTKSFCYLAQPLPRPSFQWRNGSNKWTSQQLGPRKIILCRGGCSGWGVQWIGVVLYSKTA